MSHRLSKTIQTECTSWPDRRSYLGGGPCDGISATCIDHRRLTTCQKQHRQNEPAGQVDIPTRVEVHVTGNPGHVQGPQMSHCLSKTTQTE